MRSTVTYTIVYGWVVKQHALCVKCMSLSDISLFSTCTFITCLVQNTVWITHLIKHRKHCHKHCDWDVYLDFIVFHWNTLFHLPQHYHHTSNISPILVGNKIVDCLSPLLQLHLHSRLNTWLQSIGQRQLQDETRSILVLEFGAPYIRGLMVVRCCLTRYHYFQSTEHSKPQWSLPKHDRK